MKRNKLNNLSYKDFNFKDWRALESSRISKDSSTTNLHNKSSSHISKYSVSREAQLTKRLHTELKSHGDSIIYNFKCLEHQSSDPLPLTESPRFLPPKLPSLTPLSIKSKRDHQNFSNTHNLSSFSLSKSRCTDIDSARTHTSQLEEKIKSFLRPQETEETESALRSYDTEVSTFRERYKQQKELIFKVLKTSDIEVMDHNLKELTTKNILTTTLRKKIEGLDSKAAHKILQKTGFTEEQLTLRSEPKQQSVDLRIKKFKDELNPDYHTINTFIHPHSHVSYDSQSPSHSISKSKDYGSILQTSKTPRGRLEARVYDFNKLTKRQLTSMVEEAKGTLDTKLEPYRLITKGVEGGPVQRIGASRGSQVRFQNSSRRHTGRLSLMTKRNRPVNLELLKKFGSVVKKLVNKMLRLGLTPEEVAVENIFPKWPLERKEAHSFINSAKKGDYKACKNLLKINKYLVYDYDNTDQTALHWAAKRGHNAIVKLLLEHKADPDALDLSKRTPLFFAAKGHHLLSLKLLLYHGANPMLRSVRGKLPVDYAGSHEMIKLYLRKAFRMHIILGNCSGRRYLERWGKMDKTEFKVAEYDIDYFQ